MIEVDIPSPVALRGGWAALAAVLAARGWNDVRATGDCWLYHDGGGNWASLCAAGDGRAVLFGHDHEYSDTYYGEAAAYFQEEETDLLAGAPDWWGEALSVPPEGQWIGFVYGWDGKTWQRADYDKADGFRQLGLFGALSVPGEEGNGPPFGRLRVYAEEAPGFDGGSGPDTAALAALVAADADITSELLEAVVPGWDVAAGVAAGRRFLETGVR